MKYFLILSIFLLVGVVLLPSLPGLIYSQTQVNEVDIVKNATYPDEPIGEYYGQKIPAYQAAELPKLTQVLGSTSANKRIEIDLTNQHLYAYEGDQKVYDFLISSGKWGRTPTGTFEIWAKVKSTKMEGGSKALRTYYYLPRVPYTMFFYNKNIPKSRGYGIHGAYWHNNFGQPMSHGCINMKPEEAGLIYQWAEPIVAEDSKWYFVKKDIPSTPVIIYGTAPKT